VSSVGSFAGAQIWTGHRLGGKPPGICGNPMAERYFTRIDEAIRFWMPESSLPVPNGIRAEQCLKGFLKHSINR
jgi:hypothetical protein